MHVDYYPVVGDSSTWHSVALAGSTSVVLHLDLRDLLSLVTRTPELTPSSMCVLKNTYEFVHVQQLYMRMQCMQYIMHTDTKFRTTILAQ